MVKLYVPDRQDIIWLNFEPQQGKEIKKTRPALVLSPADYNSKVGLAICIPITSQVKGYPFEVIIQNTQINGCILCDHLRSLDWRVRKANFITKCDDLIFMDVIEKIKVLII